MHSSCSRRLTPLMLLLFGLLSACTWVELTEGGRNVVLTDSAPTDCKQIGKAMSTVKADIASIDRNKEKVATELATLARNSAAGMGGNTIVPLGPVSENGEQVFAIYSCDQ